MSRQSKAYLFGLAAVLCWSTVATAFKLSLAHLSPAQLLFFAALVSWLLLGGMLALKGELVRVLSVSRSDCLASLVFGAINPCAYYLVLFQAYALLPAQEAQAINYTWALTMALLAVPLLGHRLRLQELAAALVCYLGVLVISTRGELLTLEFANGQGVALALASTVLWALYWILNARDQRDPVQGLFLNFSFGVPLVALYCFWQGEFSGLSLAGLPGAVYVGVFEMGLSFVLWLNAMRYTESTARISNLIFISPFLSLVFIYFLLGEPILPSTLWGLGLILTGLLLQQLRRREPVPVSEVNT
ncbi:DMT family transporter [Motiliproteus sp. SC1-56]|uniref:DMT family transporter n=1 Tax=Motiliproteus sp. SC1-56 TaxID=2799565 RepID=UPI001A8EAED5|nr:DMT family transporter [Motiliproteus sp. SC1-56]